MSHVYLARHALLKRPAALKVLKPHLATDEAVTRFQREAQLCSQLSHPNTARVYKFGQLPEGAAYFVMDYMEGKNLAHVVRAEGLWPRSLLTPFADDVRLTRADQDAYRSYAATERHKSSEHVDVTFDRSATSQATVDLPVPR